MVQRYSEHEKLIAEAVKALRHLNYVQSDSFDIDEQERRIVIADGDYTGRPPVKKEIQIERAQQSYDESLAELKKYEKDQGVDATPISEIEQKALYEDEKRGRKKGGRALALQKYIRRIERKIDDTMAAPESDFVQPEGASGRPKMSRAEKIKNFENLVDKARKELEVEYRIMDPKEVLWHQVHDLKSDRRQLRLALRNPDNNQSARIWKRLKTEEAIKEELLSVTEKIAAKEHEMRTSELKTHRKAVDNLSELSLEEVSDYRKTLENLIKEQKKIKELEAQAKELGIDVSVLKAK
ncbi:hypothetical protein [Marinobacter qingdaonensis]|uniref:Uncharacterized protein n=1 Tax=Marinobacter qingdaonensis TaxID=3108486 RepID=A0ABU5NUT6_9GAMM|nr:hypothetical protein [Marinobacter sp. ASW11-75]MEA1079543.1 hypothetical protein [Marinobacter sp. ASW11-75]